MLSTQQAAPIEQTQLLNLAAKPTSPQGGKVNLESLRHRHHPAGHRAHHGKKAFHGRRHNRKGTKKVEEDIVFDRPTWADFPGYGWGAYGAAPYGAWGVDAEFPGAWGAYGAAAPFYGAEYPGYGAWTGAYGAAPFDAYGYGLGGEFGAWGAAPYGASWAGAWDSLNWNGAAPFAGYYGAFDGLNAWNGLGAWNGAGAWAGEWGYPGAGFGYGAWGTPLAEPYLDVPNYTWLP